MLGVSISIIVGGLLGYFFRSDFILSNSGNFIDLGLCLLLFFVGIDIGDNSGLFADFKTFGKKIWLLPICTIFGSLLGGAIASLITPLNVGQSMAVSAGLGWYSLSAIELSKISAHLGSLAFLSNVVREVLAIIFVPIIAKKLGAFESVSAAGATAMDTLLPVINRSNTSDISIVAFFSGVILTSSVPILVPAIVTIFNL
ncbi:MAG: lysine exporter LysO family protein [Cetobacterium sp.]|uniref:lysine exporter LysO family protein n=1 Tax=unclassified Cetobacterium TaxID=2630983 RepID=UPI00163C212F|nr:lysine exporter LysO family protein [Cetobacterium sp. 2A]MBC2855803.1 lysine exporter LysO family protein [Cetobacterium sp. 2A]